MTDSAKTQADTFVCECIESARSSCLGEGFYGEHEGRRYCVLHLPTKAKSERFRQVLTRKLENLDYNFLSVWFPDEVSFVGTQFVHDATFSGATFSAEADFAQVRFRGLADFGVTTFGAGANFVEAEFSAAANFGTCKFTGPAHFSRAQFLGSSYFDWTGFNETVTFNSALFKEVASFFRVDFKRQVDWHNVIFAKKPTFTDSTFGVPGSKPESMQLAKTQIDVDEKLMKTDASVSSHSDRGIALINAFSQRTGETDLQMISEAVANVLALGDIEILKEHNRSQEMLQEEQRKRAIEQDLSAIEQSKVRLRFLGVYMAGVLSIASGIGAVFLVKYLAVVLSLGFLGIAAACAGAAFSIATGVAVRPRDFVDMLGAGKEVARGIDRINGLSEPGEKEDRNEA